MSYGTNTTDIHSQQFVTHDQIVQILLDHEKNHPGATFFSVTQITRANTNKSPRVKFTMPYLKVGASYYAKVSRVQGMIGFDYEGNVNKQREREGSQADFVVGTSWADSYEGSKVINSCGDGLYLYYRPLNVSAEKPPMYAAFNGDIFISVNSTEVAQYTRDNRTAQYQELDKAVEVRKISTRSIAALKLSGVEYIIIDIDATRKQILNACSL